MWSSSKLLLIFSLASQTPTISAYGTSKVTHAIVQSAQPQKTDAAKIIVAVVGYPVDLWSPVYLELPLNAGYVSRTTPLLSEF